MMLFSNSLIFSTSITCLKENPERDIKETETSEEYRKFTDNMYSHMIVYKYDEIKKTKIKLY